MTCITSQQKTDLQGDLAATIAQIDAIDATLSNSVLIKTKEYSFDSGTGRQQEKFNTPMELINLRRSLVATRDLLRRKLNGTNVISQKTRR